MDKPKPGEESDEATGTHEDGSSVEDSESPNGPQRRAKRKRPRTRALRLRIATEIEKAVSVQHSPIQHLLSVDPRGTVSAPLKEVVASLGLDTPQYRALSPVALLKMSNVSASFRIEGTNHEDATLVVASNFVDVDSATVYLDRLPRRCSVKLIERRMKLFGTVASIRPIYRDRRNRICKSTQSSDQQPSTSSAAVSSPCSARILSAFVQFTSAFAAQKCCDAYWWNMPGRRFSMLKFQMMRKRGPKHFIPRGPATVDGFIATARRKARKRKISLGSVTDEPLAKKARPTAFNVSSDVSATSGTVDVTLAPIGDGAEDSPLNGASLSNCVRKRSGKAAGSSAVKRRNRQHRKKRPKPRCKHTILHVKSYFRRMQVLPLAKFKQLRIKYLRLKQQRMKALKRELHERNVPLNIPGESKRVRKKRRGRNKLIARAMKARERREDGLV